MMHNTAPVGYTFAYGMDLFFFHHLQSHQSSVSFLGKGDKAQFLVYTMVAWNSRRKRAWHQFLYIRNGLATSSTLAAD